MWDRLAAGGLTPGCSRRGPLRSRSPSCAIMASRSARLNRWAVRRRPQRSANGAPPQAKPVVSFRYRCHVYAITHAATALLVKRRFPKTGLWPLLIGTQAIELLWVVFVYAGIEHVRYTRDAVHLDFLPYSHSVGSTLAVALLVAAAIRYRHSEPTLAVAVPVAVLSHVILDLIHHESDIALLPVAFGPRFGLGLASIPAADLCVEIAYGALCWYLFRGRPSLLIAIVVFNILNAPLMFSRPGIGAQLAAHPRILPTLILTQIVLTWVAVWYFAREPRSTPPGHWEPDA